MAIQGRKEGLKTSNKINKKVSALIDPKTLRERYLFGIDLKDEAGNEMSNDSLQSYIDNATSLLEHFLDISITPHNGQVEERDYHYNEYVDYGFFQLNNFPIRKVNSIKLAYFRDETGEPETAVTIPLNWIRLTNHSGIIRLIPNAKFPASLQMSASGNFFPEILKSGMIPDLWVINYDHGFEDGCIPTAINDAIARMATIQVLTVAGSLVIGAGIASESLSIDGLSQSVNTTQSAQNSVFSSNIIDNQNVLFGNRVEDEGLLTTLKNYYKGAEMYML